MSFPKKISIEINKVVQGEQQLFEVVMYKGKVKVKTASPKMKLALTKAVDAFETKFTQHIEKDLL